MVSSHNKNSYVDGGSYQCAHKESCQVNCSSQATSFLEIPPYQDIPEKPHIADEESEKVFSQSQNEDRPVGGSISKWPVTAEQYPGSRRPMFQYENDPGSFCSLRSITSNTHEDVRSEHVKRPLTIDRSHQHPYKRARQGDHYDLPLYFELSLPRTAPVEPLISVAACKEVRNNRDTSHEEPSGNASRSTSSLPWVPFNNREGEHGSELPMQTPSPCFVVNKGQCSGFIQAEDVYFSTLDYYPRRHVAVGPDHQADIPVSSPQPMNRSTENLDPAYFHHVTDEDVNKFMGTCVIPMPDFTVVASDASIVPVTGSACSCNDEGSIRCVKHHVMEAREKLKEMLGLAKFNEMGFCDMGECVAQKWTEDEERTFLDVVSSNPASLGKNFWDLLPQVFPSKSSKELVSYYFNVFVLRKRAEQNRLDPVNIDSDNDEWQDSDDGEFATEYCESDSVVETPGDQDDVYNNDGHEEDDFREGDEDGDACDDYVADEDHSQELNDFSKGQIHLQSSYVPRMHQREVCVHDVAEDHDIQDDSCTSYEAQHTGANSSSGPAVEYSGLGQGHSRDVGQCNVLDPIHIMSPDGKSWDLNYFSGQEKNVDFLPTCHVIEEVFGKGSWPDEPEDGQRVS